MTVPVSARKMLGLPPKVLEAMTLHIFRKYMKEEEATAYLNRLKAGEDQDKVLMEALLLIRDRQMEAIRQEMMLHNIPENARGN